MINLDNIKAAQELTERLPKEDANTIHNLIMDLFILNYEFEEDAEYQFKTGCYISSRCTYRFKEGQLHAIGKPAVEYFDGFKQWCIDGNLHREDGPAIESAEYQQWYLDNRKIEVSSNEEFLKRMKLKAFW